MSGETVNVCQSIINVNPLVVNQAHIVQGQPQRKDVSPAIVRQHQSLKYVNNVSCVNRLSSIKLAPNVQNVAQNLPVGARLNLGPLLQGQTRIAKLKSAYNSLIVGRRGLGW